MSLQRRVALVTGAAQGSNMDALEEYLKSDTLAAHVNNPIQYWVEYLRANERHAERAALARMAIDYLAIPGILFSYQNVRTLISAFMQPRLPRRSGLSAADV